MKLPVPANAGGNRAAAQPATVPPAPVPSAPAVRPAPARNPATSVGRRPGATQPSVGPRPDPTAAPVVSIREVIKDASERILAQGIDFPAPGNTGCEYSIDIAGWVVGRERTVVAVEVVSGNRVIRSAQGCFPRKDVLETYPDHPEPSGYRMQVGLVGLPQEFELILRCLMDDGSYTMLGRIIGRRRAFQSAYEPVLQPLMLTSLGRMGTTWMMRLLSEHPAVVAYRDYPYEVMAARYWAHQLRVLAAPADYLASSDPDSFAEDMQHIGHNPFFGPLLRRSPGTAQWLGRDHVERMAAFCQQTIDGFYGHVAALQGQPGVRYFAEKSLPDHIPAMMADLYPGMREVVLVRDLRDVVCSMLAFNSKRGYQSFGRDKAGSDAAFARQLATDMSTLASSWESRASTSLLVRYEDLIARPEDVLGSVFSYLGVDGDPETVRSVLERASTDTDELAAHRTSRDPGASVGRWRTDMPAELIEHCNRAFGPVMARFGYGDVAA